jgi:hypothetical protein
MSTLHVENLKGPTSGANANKIIVPSGQELHAAGHVIQVVTSTKNDQTQITSTSAVDTGLSVSITPKFNTSKIFISLGTLGICYQTNYVYHNLLRGSTVIHGNNAYNNNTTWMPINFAISHLDSPATTSAITYKTQAYISNVGDLRFNYNASGTTHTASITAMEIAQ